MTKELKPCPFCGSEPFIEKSTRYPKPKREPVDGYTVVCKNFDCIGYRADDWYRRSEKKAAEAWNTRYKRTCEWYFEDYHDEANNIWTTECGERFAWAEYGHPKCCPSCGAEVLDD